MYVLENRHAALVNGPWAVRCEVGGSDITRDTEDVVGVFELVASVKVKPVR